MKVGAGPLPAFITCHQRPPSAWRRILRYHSLPMGHCGHSDSPTGRHREVPNAPDWHLLVQSIIGTNGKVIGSAIYHRQPTSPNQRDIELIDHSTHLAGIAIERGLTGEAMQLATLVYQNSAEAMLVTDPENRIIAINPAFTTVTGYTFEEVQGHDPGILSSGRQDRAFYHAMWTAIKNTGQWQGEIWNRRKDGSEYAEWLTINTIYGDDGAVHRRVALFSDITERKQAEALIWNQANWQSDRLPSRV